MRYLINRDNYASTTMRNIKFIMFALILLYITFYSVTYASASATTGGSQVNVRVDYVEEIAVVSAGTGGSIKFYMSTDNKRSWDVLDPSGVVDISSILQNKDTIIYFKGNKDKGVREYTLLGLNSTLKVTYKKTNGEGSIVYEGTSPVEYRKGSYGAWKTAPNSMSTSIYEIKGATLYFRYSATTNTRAGKIVTLKIPKRPAAPSVSIDGSKLLVNGMKNGETQYRVGDATIWQTFTTADNKIKTMDLKALLAPTASANVPLPAGVFEFRVLGGDKKITSAVKVLEVDAQPIVPETISINGTTLKITDTDTKRAYEYTRVEKGNVLKLDTARWTTITSARAVVVPKAAVGDKIYVRLKSTTSKDTKIVTPASTYKELDVTAITLK